MNFVETKNLDLGKMVPPFPAAKSLAAMTDLETVLRIQQTRTAVDVEWARGVTKTDVFSSSDLVGPWFTAANLPVTARLLENVNADAIALANRAKDIFKRERPYAVSSAVTPCVDKPKGYSYPSTFAVEVCLRAAVLGELFPEKRTDLIAQAHQQGWGRVVGGVHFPSDIVGGRLLVDAIFPQMKQDPAYKVAVENVRAEIANVKPK